MRQLHFIKALIFGNQSTHLGANVLGWRGFGFTEDAVIAAILARMKQELSFGDGTVAHHGVQLADIGLGKPSCSRVDDVVDAGEVVIRFNQIIHLDRLKAHRDFAFLIDFFHLIEHEPVTGQTVGAVAEVDLYVIEETVVDLLCPLALQLLHKLGDRG